MQLISTKSITKLSLLPNTIFYSALIILVSVLPFSEYIISLSQFILAGSWLLSGNFSEKLHRLKSNKFFWIVATVYLMHLLGVVYTSDIQYALKDLRIKAPLLLLPLLFASSKPLSKKQFNWVLTFFVASVTIAALYALGYKSGIWLNIKANARSASEFISHIRFSLMMCLSIFILFYFLTEYNKQLNTLLRYLSVIVIALLTFILFYNPFFTGVFVLIITGICYFFVFYFKQLQTTLKILSIALVIALPIAGLAYIKTLEKKVYAPNSSSIKTLDSHSELGNPYSHRPNNPQAENGHQVYNYICEQELEPAWNKISKLDYTGLDNRNNELRITLFRFLSSKGLRKDAEGIKQLSENEIKAIENSISNADFLSGSLLKHRIYQTVWEYYMYKMASNPSGHSAIMRIIYWQTAFHIIKQNVLIGVGTGDIKNEFKEAYIDLNTKLHKRYQRRSHNQYISIAVSFGVIGLLYFLFSLFYPLIFYKNQYYNLYFLFAVICLISMLTEDTLESQVGVTFFAFFNSLFLFLAPKQNS